MCAELAGAAQLRAAAPALNGSLWVVCARATHSRGIMCKWTKMLAAGCFACAQTSIRREHDCSHAPPPNSFRQSCRLLALSNVLRQTATACGVFSSRGPTEHVLVEVGDAARVVSRITWMASGTLLTPVRGMHISVQQH
jgi:hypothetical protein